MSSEVKCPICGSVVDIEDITEYGCIWCDN